MVYNNSQCIGLSLTGAALYALVMEQPADGGDDYLVKKSWVERREAVLSCRVLKSGCWENFGVVVQDLGLVSLHVSWRRGPAHTQVSGSFLRQSQQRYCSRVCRANRANVRFSEIIQHTSRCKM